MIATFPPDGKQCRVVLTGAAGGMGQAFAQKLATLCNEIVIVGRNESTVQTLALTLQNRHPHLKVYVCAGDLQNPHTLDSIQTRCEKMGGLDLLINNAGINCFGPSQGIAIDDLHNILRTNLLAPMILSNALIPFLKQSRTAQIIQVGSILGYIGYPGNAAYCASKFGLRGYTEALSRELVRTHIKVKYFAPRATATAINEGAVNKLNAALNVQTDSTDFVAEQLIHCLKSSKREWPIGFPERLFVFLNKFLPRLNDKAIKGQLPIIEKFFPAERSTS